MENKSDEVNKMDLSNTSTDSQVNMIITEMVVKEISLTESVILNDVASQSTLVQAKKDDSYKMFERLQAKMCIRDSVETESVFIKQVLETAVDVNRYVYRLMFTVML